MNMALEVGLSRNTCRFLPLASRLCVGISVVAGLAGSCQRSPSLAPSLPPPSASSPASAPAASLPPSQVLTAATLKTPSGASAARRDEAPRWPSQVGGETLPEDPVAGKRAEEQWRAHLAREDRERQLARDRHTLAHHKAILALLLRARRDVERARSEKAVRAATARIAETESQVEKRLGRINVWGNVSPMTATYSAMLRSLSEELPRDRLTAVADAADGRADSRLDWNRRLAEIRAYLRETAESEGEGE